MPPQTTVTVVEEVEAENRDDGARAVIVHVPALGRLNVTTPDASVVPVCVVAPDNVALTVTPARPMVQVVTVTAIEAGEPPHALQHGQPG